MDEVQCHRCSGKVPIKYAGGFRHAKTNDRYIWTCHECIAAAGGMEAVVRQTKVATMMVAFPDPIDSK